MILPVGVWAPQGHKGLLLLFSSLKFWKRNLTHARHASEDCRRIQGKLNMPPAADLPIRENVYHTTTQTQYY